MVLIRGFPAFKNLYDFGTTIARYFSSD